MEPPFTRERLQNFNISKVMRDAAIDQTVKRLTHIILYAASKSPHQEHLKDWKMVGNKLVIYKEILSSLFHQKNPFTSDPNSQKPYTDILPDVFEKLRIVFPGVEFRMDELESYIIVDWS